MSKTFCDELHDHCNCIRHIAHALEQLSYHFAMTGNEHVARELCRAAGSLHEQQEKLNAAYDAEVSHQVREANASAANTLRAALAGIVIGRQ